MNENVPHTEGAPWDVYKRFSTFKEANEVRDGLLEEMDTLQVKVHWMSKSNKYVVKTRLDPTAAVAEAKKEEKRRRKKRLNKKRRKK